MRCFPAISCVGRQTAWRLLSALLPTALGVMKPDHASARQIVIPDRVSCAECRIDVSEIVAVGDSVEPGVLGEYGSLRFSDGRYFVQTGVQPGTILVFGHDGRYVRSIGRLGKGPGEYTRPQVFHARGDSLWLFDITGRITMDFPGNVRTANVPFGPFEAIRLGNGLHVYSTVARIPELIGIPLHIFDEASETLVRSFGNRSGFYDPRDPYDARRTIAPSGEREFWAASLNRYVIEKWTVDGERIVRIERDAPWFEPWRGRVQPARVAAPPPILHGVMEDSAGILWVFLRVADRNWAPQAPADVRGSETRTSMAQHTDLWDTLIEAIDAKSGVVLARARLPHYLIGMAGQDLFYTYQEVGAGHPQYVVWRASLRRNTPSNH
jgi:hypothetical protein